MVLVGVSTGTDMKNVHNTVVAIKEALELVTWASSQDSDLDEDSGGTNSPLPSRSGSPIIRSRRNHFHDADEQYDL